MNLIYQLFHLFIKQSIVLLEVKWSLTSNDRFLLMHQKPNLCLVDREMNIVKEVLWTHDDIH